MDLARLSVSEILRPFEPPLCIVADTSCSYAIPNNDEGDGNGKNQCGNGVDLRSDATAEAAPDFERERVVAADEKESYGDFVHRQGEDEKSGGDQRKLEIRQRDPPESLPSRGAEIERGFFLGAICFLQAGEKFSSGYGDESSAVAEKHCQQAELHAGKYDEHQQREAGDNTGKNERKKNEPAEEGFARKIGAVEGERSEQA